MIYFISFTLWALSIWISNPALALFLGIFLAFLFKLPEDYFTRQYGSRILQTGIVFLGGSISIGSIYEINSAYFFWISTFVLFSLGAVLVLGRLLGVSKRFSFLIASGTAICGGTAIASVAPVIKAQPNEVTAALTIVFILNAVGVLIFPLAYDFLELSEKQFGAWVALAIHDTASVVGAAAAIGENSVEVAATLKVARTIWIVPLVIFSAWIFRNQKDNFGLPLFVVLFVMASLLNAFFEPNAAFTSYLKLINKICLLTGLFCIGTQISLENLKTIKIKSVILASSVWAFIVPISLILVQKI